MNSFSKKLLMALLVIFVSVSFASAKLETAIEAILKSELGDYQERLDQVIIKGEEKWLLIKPNKTIRLKKEEEKIQMLSSVAEVESAPISLISKTKDQDFLFSNGWIYTPVRDNSIKSFDYYPEIFQDILLQSKLHQELIVPKGFKLPRDLAFIAGRIPVKLGSIELASDREIIYQKKLEEMKSKKPFEFLTYSFNSGKLQKLSIDKGSNEKLDSIYDFEAEKLDLNYLSNIKSYAEEIYFSDLISGSIFKFEKLVSEYDATKPLQEIAEDDLVEKPSLKKVFDLNELDLDDGIKDFEFNSNKSKLYVITKKTSNLLIVDYKDKSLIKRLELPKMIDDFRIISRSSQEPDVLVFFSKANSTIFFVNTFDLRVSEQIKLSKLDKEFNYIPFSLLVSSQKVLLGVEKVAKTGDNVSTAGLIVFDPITSAFEKFIDLKATPKELILSKDNKSIFILADKNDNEMQLLKIRAVDYELSSDLTFDADIAQASSVTEIVDGHLLAVPSSVSKNIVLVDIESMMVLKKIELNESINVLKSIN